MRRAVVEYCVLCEWKAFLQIEMPIVWISRILSHSNTHAYTYTLTQTHSVKYTNTCISGLEKSLSGPRCPPEPHIISSHPSLTTLKVKSILNGIGERKTEKFYQLSAGSAVCCFLLSPFALFHWPLSHIFSSPSVPGLRHCRTYPQCLVISFFFNFFHSFRVFFAFGWQCLNSSAL